jgi:hypothetical protein
MTSFEAAWTRADHWRASDDDPSGIGTYSQAGALRRRDVMGKLMVKGWLYWLGWASTAAMALASSAWRSAC